MNADIEEKKKRNSLSSVYNRLMKEYEPNPSILVDISVDMDGVNVFDLVKDDDGTVHFCAMRYDEDGRLVSQISSDEITLEVLLNIVCKANKHMLKVKNGY